MLLQVFRGGLGAAVLLNPVEPEPLELITEGLTALSAGQQPPGETCSTNRRTGERAEKK